MSPALAGASYHWAIKEAHGAQGAIFNTLQKPVMEKNLSIYLSVCQLSVPESLFCTPETNTAL